MDTARRPSVGSVGPGPRGRPMRVDNAHSGLKGDHRDDQALGEQGMLFFVFWYPTHLGTRRLVAGGTHTLWDKRGARRGFNWGPKTLPGGHATPLFFGLLVSVAACLQDLQAHPHCRDNWVKWLKYHTLQLGHPDPTPGA